MRNKLLMQASLVYQHDVTASTVADQAVLAEFLVSGAMKALD
jgi:hypothetical protein